MIYAYNLESKAAIYPRIVIDPKLVSEIEPGYRAAFLAQDVDGLWFIDPFSMGIVSGNADALLEDGYDPHEVSLKSLGNKIEMELSHLSDAGHLAKWNWLKSRYTIAVLEFGKFGKPRFWHILEKTEKVKKSIPN